MKRINMVVLAVASGSVVTGCSSLKPKGDVDQLPAPSAGISAEYVIDNSNPGFYTDGEWKQSSVTSGYIGEGYLAAESGTGAKTATWNLNIVKRFDVFVRWTSHSNRGTNVKYVVHHLNEQDNLTTTTVEVDQTEFGGEWFKLGTFRMSSLTSRVTVSNDANGYVIADAVLFEEAPATSSADADADNDSMPDAWELNQGLDPTNALDAGQDPDGDGLTNLQEFLGMTAPFNLDTDSDGMPDGYETTASLDPTSPDSDLDADGDGYTNYQEYLAGTEPTNAASVLAANTVLLTWEPPVTRTDGNALSPEEIDYYELKYARTDGGSTAGIVSDNSSPEFVVYGSDSSTSTATKGYIGENYVAMPAGSGENVASWLVSNVTPGTEHRVSVNWTSYSNRATNATYRVQYESESGSIEEKQFTVDQTSGGGIWQNLGSFIPGASQVTVSLSNNADGYVIADAIKLEPIAAAVGPIRIEAENQSYVVSDLPPGTWQFQIRAVDTNGVASDYTDPQVTLIE
ncbi:golvesin C-terminal-like domain-containing protein [Marinobacter subterrani]|uniref:Golvesin/Xly CBD-like domain-containing protein n=1 Tax=Marinobacter subterrani TaxID=1658765 RepID=A0A0J7M0G8_9GAMM|nr:hypothetical protein [Marinobacter subterrani]KMQ74600.1 hypothetical protein Msub_10786 [Marinobacter subterrani]